MTDGPPSCERDAEALQRLLLGTAAGRRSDFAALYARAAPRLYRIALLRAKSAAIAQEVLQEVFLLIWRRAATYDPARGDAFRWMAGILRHRLADAARRREVPTDPLGAAAEAPHGGRSPEAEALTRLDGGRAARALAGLPEGMRRAIELAYLEEASYAEIAAALAVPVNTAKSWVRRGLLRLRAALEADRAPPP